MKKILAISLLTSVLFSASSNAELISGSFLEANDNLITLDTTTGLEWLDLTLTRGMTVDAIMNDSYFAGWRVATRSESDHFVVGSYTSGNGIDLISKTVELDYAYGIYEYSSGSYTMSGAYSWNSGYSAYGGYDRYGNRSDFGVWLVSDGGVSLSSISNPDMNTVGFEGDINAISSVPISGSIALMGLGLFGMSRLGKSK